MDGELERPPWLAALGDGWASPWSCPEKGAEESGPDYMMAIADTDFCGLPIAEELMGGGLSLLEAAASQRAIAMNDPGVAIGLNMHTFTIGLMYEHWLRYQDVSGFLLEGIAETQALVASAFAEPGGGSNLLKATTSATPVDRGFVVSGEKYPCSLASVASLLCLNAFDAASGQTLVALIPAASPGVETTMGWPSLGMQSSDTGRVTLRDVFVDQRLVFHQAPFGEIDDMVIAGLVWFIVTMVGTYHGVMTRLLTLAVDRAESEDHHRTALCAEATHALSTLGLAAQGLAIGWQDGRLSGQSALRNGLSLRLQLSETKTSILASLQAATGSRSYTSNHPEAGLLLDVMASDYHPPSIINSREALHNGFHSEAVVIH